MFTKPLSIWNRIRLSRVPVGSGLVNRDLKRMFSASAVRFQNIRKCMYVHNVHINYESVGEGPYAILCLPGAFGSIEADFRPHLAHMNSKLFTMICWDPPGYGYSRPPNRDFSLGRELYYKDARLAAALMKKLEFKTYSLLGWSDGGITALILAAIYPEFVYKLVVSGANAFIDKEDVEIYQSIKNVDNWSPKMRAPMINIYGEEYFRKCWSEWVDFNIGIFANGGDICKSELHKIICPTLIVHGEKDPLVPMCHPEYLYQNIQQSELVIWAKGKDSLQPRFYGRFNSLVENFLTKKHYG